MEQLLHYVWKHRLLPLTTLTTTDGQPVEVIDPGLHNRNAGPDFFNAKVRIGPTLWVGNVEMHDRASDWFAHRHDGDAHYNNVILHVVGVADQRVHTADGKEPPQLVLDVPREVRQNYEELLAADGYPPCCRVVPEMSGMELHAWLSTLATERLEQKTEAIARRVAQKGGAWEDGYFVTLARNYGFGINGDAFEQWAMNVPLQQVAHHRDDLFQVEALFMGQAGLLDAAAVPERYRAAALADGYFVRLCDEYRYLARKFSLRPIDHGLWRFLRLRPQNFPHIRISQLANLYFQRRAGLSQLVECRDVEAVAGLMRTSVTPYWETHYTFGAESTRSRKQLSALSVNLLLINTAIPMLFAYGRHRQDEALCDRALDFLEQLRAENNHIVRMWKDCGLAVATAADSQALVQLKNAYCDRRECLRCRIGYRFLSGGSRGGGAPGGVDSCR